MLKKIQTFLVNPVEKKSFLSGVLFLLFLSSAAGFWFGALNFVDPVHHEIYFYKDILLRFLCVAFPLFAVLLWLFYRYKLHVNPAALLCSAGAAAAAFCPSFTMLAVSLTLLSFAVWVGFDCPFRQSGKDKIYLAAVAVLFVYVFASGFEQQLNAYNRMVFLYSDWGIYFAAYKRLAEAPFDSFFQYFSAGNHFNLSVNIVMAAVIKLLPRAETVFAVNSLVIASVVPLTFWLGRCLKLPVFWSCLCAVAMAFNPTLSNQHTALTYGFHPINFLLPSFLLFCIAKEKSSRAGMISAAIFMCGIKETVFVFASGAALLFAVRKKWLYAAGTFLLAGGAFLLITHVILPECDGSENYFQLFQYNSLGNNFLEVLLSPVLSPGVFWGKLLRPGNLSFMLFLLLPFLPGALKAPRFLLAALPVGIGILLKDCYADKHNIVQQYGIEMTVWFTAAMVYGTAEGFRKKQLTAGFAAALLAGSLSGYYFVGKTPWGGTYSAVAVRRSPDISKLRAHVRKLIPSGASVAVSEKWGGQLAESHSNLIFRLDSENADYTILDFTDSSADLKKMMAIRDKFLLEQTHHPVGFLNLKGCEAVIFKKGRGIWNLPFIINGTPEKILPHGTVLAVNVPGVRARAIVFNQNSKLLILASSDPQFRRDLSFDISAVCGSERKLWKLRWGYGLFPAYMMKRTQSFVIELPLPRHWQKIDSIEISTRISEL